MTTVPDDVDPGEALARLHATLRATWCSDDVAVARVVAELADRPGWQLEHAAEVFPRHWRARPVRVSVRASEQAVRDVLADVLFAVELAVAFS